jgi:hypothetical protein
VDQKTGDRCVSSDSASCSLGAMVLRRAAEHRLSRQALRLMAVRLSRLRSCSKEGEIRVEEKDKERTGEEEIGR